MCEYHSKINDKLNIFIEKNKIPNILFHGPSGSGKKTILTKFINKIYNDDNNIIKKYVLTANCGHGKGIKFVREDLKFFARSNIDLQDGKIFKSIILLNADKLTCDAQSALRRCIELFSHSTRFFIIVENKEHLLKPIISRFCEFYIYIPSQIKYTNIHEHNINKLYPYNEKLIKEKNLLIKKKLLTITFDGIFDIVNLFYSKGISGLDIINFIKNSKTIEEKFKYDFLFNFYKIKKEFRNEKMIILFILNYFLRYNNNLENIDNY
jgi:DNA polymerase III delta prime subunit